MLCLKADPCPVLGTLSTARSNPLAQLEVGQKIEEKEVGRWKRGGGEKRRRRRKTSKEMKADLSELLTSHTRGNPHAEFYPLCEPAYRERTCFGRATRFGFLVTHSNRSSQIDVS